MDEPTQNDYHFPARNSFWLFGVPMAIAISVLGCFLIVYTNNYENRHLNQQIQESSQIISHPIRSGVENYAAEVDRMGERWEMMGGTPETFWAQDAKNYLADNRVFKTIAVITPNLVIQWIVPAARTEYIGFDIKTLPGQINLFKEAADNKHVMISPIVKFLDGTAGFIIIKPLNVNNKLQGYIAAAVDVKSLFKDLLGNGLGNDYNIAIYQAGKLVYAVGNDKPTNPYRVVHRIKVLNMEWKIVVSPTVGMINKVNTKLPLAISIGTLFSAMFILGLFYFYQRSREFAWKMLHISEQNKKVAYRLEKIIDTVNEGFIAFDEQGRIIDWNPYAEKIFGWKKEEVIGKDVHALTVPKRHIEGLREAMRQIIAGQPHELFNREVEFKALRRDGCEFIVEVVTVPICIDGKFTFQSFIRDVKQRKNAEADQAQLASIIDASDDPIISMTTTGTILTWNKGAENLFGYKAQDIIGKSVQVLYPEDEVKKVEDIFQKVNQGMHITQADTVRIAKNGQHISVSDSFTPIYDKNGKINRISSIIHDISDLKKVDKMKNEFVSTVSHELRTPLTSIRGSLGLLVSGKMGELNEKSKQLVDIAINNCERLIRLINDILDVEKIAAGKMEYHFKLLNLDELMLDAVAINQGMAVKNNVELRLETEVGLEVYVDYDRYMQMMTNLLSNAIRYSQKSGVVLIKSAVVNDHVRIEVNNKGSIIPESFREKIFGKFSQADSSNTREKGGTGLGLSITKSIVEKLGGQINYESNEKDGTTFFVTLPLAARNHLLKEGSFHVATE